MTSSAVSLNTVYADKHGPPACLRFGASVACSICTLEREGSAVPRVQNDEKLKFLRRFITGLRWSEEIDPAYEKIRRIRLAHTLRVSGGAIILTIRFTESEGIRNSLLSASYREIIRIIVETPLGSIDHRIYHVERIAYQDDSVQVFIYGYEPTKKVGPLAKLRLPDESQGERWLRAVDGFQEKVRQLFTPKGGIFDEMPVSAEVSWIAGKGIFPSGGFIDNKDPRRQLEDDLWSLRRQESYHRNATYVALYLMIFLLVGIIALLPSFIESRGLQRNSPWSSPQFIVLIYVIVALVIFTYFFALHHASRRRIRNNIQALLEEIDLQAISS